MAGSNRISIGGSTSHPGRDRKRRCRATGWIVVAPPSEETQHQIDVFRRFPESIQFPPGTLQQTSMARASMSGKMNVKNRVESELGVFLTIRSIQIILQGPQVHSSPKTASHVSDICATMDCLGLVSLTALTFNSRTPLPSSTGKPVIQCGLFHLQSTENAV